MEKYENKISCICLTKGNLSNLHRSIHCFLTQTYPNKELLITLQGSNASVKDFILSQRHANIHYIEVVDAPEMTLGEIRNYTIEKSSGSYFCTWDDDDWYHKDRLTFQMQQINLHKKAACTLINLLVLDIQNKKSYITHARFWENSLICDKAVLSNNIKYDPKNQGEDSPLVAQLVEKQLIVPVVNPKLYIYAYHGGNTSGDAHFRKIISNAIELNGSQTKTIYGVYLNNHLLNKEYAPMDTSDFLAELPLVPRMFGY